MLKDNIQRVLKELEAGNNLSEKITVIAAGKTQTLQTLAQTAELGIADIGENRLNEFREKYGKIPGARYHFIGHLQTNKIKYLLGRTFLIHSVDRYNLARELASKSTAADIITDILVQINIGEEQTKGGFLSNEALDAFARIKELPNLRIKGFMAMLPYVSDAAALEDMCLKMREIYDTAKKQDDNIEYLSMGMSADYKIAVRCGSNMVRLGSTLFGQRV